MSYTGSAQELRPAVSTRATYIKVLILAVVVLLITLIAIFAHRSYFAKATMLTTAEITEMAKNTPPEARTEWLKLARAVLASENVMPVSTPEEPLNNRGEASRVELGYMLFFDPILSDDKSMSCASCHHPEYGMADGMKTGVGIGGRGYGAQREGTGQILSRNTPSVFNVAYSSIQFWDGRVGSLEEQALLPIFATDEMNLTSVGEMTSRLKAIPKYREMFAQAFGFNSKKIGAEINAQNISRAIAAFERKLNITETNYDLFVSGEDDKLTTEQLRGMVVFFGQGQCAVCHTPPKFHDDVLSAIGVPATAEKVSTLDTDPGFGAVIRKRDGFGMFKTPTLRNVSRTAPYMHNGVFKTLEEVVDFYNDGGGKGRGLKVYSQDSKVAKLDLSDQQKKDLISFMNALDSLTPPPSVPQSVPSGLPAVGK